MSAVSLYITLICALSARLLLVAASSELCDSIPDILDQLKKLQSRVDVLEQRSETLSKIESIFGGADAIDELVKKKSIIQRIVSVEERLDILENTDQDYQTDEESLETDTEISREVADIPHPERNNNKASRIRRQIPTAHSIGFTAEVSTMDLHFPDEHRTILFDHVITNVGNAYHSHTGTFIVPFSGIYVFTVTVMSSGGKDIFLQLMVDGQKISEIYADSRNNSAFDSGTRTYVLQLYAGSDVWVETGDWDDNYDIHGNGHTAFSGFLLQSRQIPTVHSIGFTAEVSTMDLHFPDDHRKIVFDDILSNVGNAYHSHTGIFVVPFSGVYVFTVTVISSPNKDVTLQLMVDGRRISNIYTDSRDYQSYGSSTRSYVLQLFAGSDVWVETGVHNYYVHGNGLTSFTGFLLQTT